jgi:ATP-binding cassette subfamily C protein
MEEDGRPVALLARKPGKYLLYDPTKRTRLDVDESVAALVQPQAQTFYRPFPEKSLTLWDLVKFSAKGALRDVWRILGMGVLGGILSIITPVATGILFDTIIPSEDRTQLATMVAALIVSAVCSTMFSLVQSLAQLRVEGRTAYYVQSAVWDRLLSLPVAFFRQFTAGDLANRSLGVDQIRQILSGAVVSTLLHLVFTVFSVALLFWYSIELAIVVLVLMVITSIFPVICVFVMVRYQRPLYDLAGKIQGLNLQFIAGIAKLRVNGAEKRAFYLWATQFAKQKELALKARRVSNMVATFSGMLPLLGTLVIFTWMFITTDVYLTHMSTGSFMAFISAMTTVVRSMTSTLMIIYPVMSIVPILARTKPILKEMPEVDTSKAHPGELTGLVDIGHVNFRYSPDGPLVAKDLSLQVGPGEFVALVGPSGSGRSTIFRLLLGFETPESGSIHFDGQDLSKLDVQAVRRQIGVVLQNGTLLAGSIFDNIVGASQLTLDDAWEAARMASVDEDIKAMPMGMHTVVGEGGAGLSGGQRQRILIARAIVRKPRIILFDEATSALDNKSQAIVSDSLASLSATRIVIAHRLTTIVNADRIYVVVAGEIVEKGTYEELMAKGGVFSELAKRQIA